MSRERVRALRPYVPGTGIEEVQKSLGLQHVIKLASNENPLGSSPKALAALGHLDRLNLYFDDAHTELRERLGARYGLQAANVVLGHGSNELVNIVCQTVLDAGDEAVMAAPSFSLYPLAVTLQGARPVHVPLDSAGVHDLDAMLAALGPKTKAVFVCDPNNPTGTAVARESWQRFLHALPEHVTLIVDQAYREYAGEACVDAAREVLERPRTLVLRTMSKIYGLASLRFGYGYADAQTIELLNRVRLPFNVSRPAELGAMGALDDDAFVQRSIELNEAGKAFVYPRLAQLGLHAFATSANFYAMSVPCTATLAYGDLLKRGIITRSGDALGMPGRLRITVGAAHENAALMDALEELVPAWRA